MLLFNIRDVAVDITIDGQVDSGGGIPPDTYTIRFDDLRYEEIFVREVRFTPQSLDIRTAVFRLPPSAFSLETAIGGIVLPGEQNAGKKVVLWQGDFPCFSIRVRDMRRTVLFFGELVATDFDWALGCQLVVGEHRLLQLKWAALGQSASRGVLVEVGADSPVEVWVSEALSQNIPCELRTVE